MFCREGMEAVNARSVAKALNCSTQPIFSYFSGMEDLKTSLEQKAKETFENALKVEQLEGDPIVNIGAAYTRFAAEQPCLFTHLFMLNKDDPLYPFMSVEARRDLVQREAEHTGLSFEQASRIYVQMSIYIHGLAAVRAAHKAEFTPEEMETMIVSMRDLLEKATRCCMENQQ